LNRAPQAALPLSEREFAMTYIEPDSPGGQPEILPPDTPEPDVDPGATPDEVPQQDPGGGEEGDSRPYGSP
jgi:hypothetical protein